MTSDSNPLIDIPKFISTPIQNMIAEMSAGDHSFLKQICTALKSLNFTDEGANEFGSLLHLIDTLIDVSPEHMKDVWIGRLHSFDNRTLFQAIAELISIGNMVFAGWTIKDWNENCIRLEHPSSGTLDLLVLSLILDRDLNVEARLQEELVQQLNTLESSFQVGLTIRTPLSRHMNFEKVVDATQKWLQKIHADPSNKRRQSGYVKDSLCHIDFRVTGRKKTAEDNTVFTVTPPVIGQRLKRNLSTMMSQSIEAVRQHRSNEDNTPVMLSIVSNQSMQLSEKAWKQLLYGLSYEETNGTTTLDTRHFGGWFQDPFRTFVGGILVAEHTPNVPEGVPCFSSITFSNPWSEYRSIQQNIPLPGYRFSRIEPAERTSRYSKEQWLLFRSAHSI